MHVRPRSRARRPTRRTLLGLSLLATAFASACDRPDPTDAPLLGTLERDRLELVATAAEPIVEVAVREGHRVAAHQVLARLDDRTTTAAVTAATARLRGAEARIAELSRGGRPERRAEVHAALDADLSELQLARLEVERLERLVADQVSPPEHLDTARTRVAAAEARVDQDRARLDELLAGATSEELLQAEAERDAAAADVAALEVALERLTLRAPVPGTVEVLPWEAGEIPDVGAPVVVLLSAGAPWVRVHVPEERRTQLRPGTGATIEADGLSEPVAGCFRFVSAEASFTPHESLSEYDRHRLAYAAEVEVRAPEDVAAALPTGLPVRVWPAPVADCGSAP